MDRPNYYAVIPADVRYDKRLKAIEKLMYGEITALTQKEGECWATNQYFSELYGISTRTISGIINKLVECNYLTSEIYYKAGTKIIDKRVIRISGQPMEKKFDTYGKNLPYPMEKTLQYPMEEIFQENNTSIINNPRRIYISVPSELEVEFNAYKQMRKAIKKPLTPYSERRALSKLQKLAPDDLQKQKEILAQSVDHCWVGLFPLKEYKREDSLPVYDTSRNKEYSDEYMDELLALRGNK